MNSIKFLKEFNAHLLEWGNELKSEKCELKGVISTLLERIQKLEKKLESEEKKSQDFFNEMLRAQCECDDLNHEIERLKGENAAPKSQKRSIYTDPVKCRKLKQEVTGHDNT